MYIHQRSPKHFQLHARSPRLRFPCFLELKHVLPVLVVPIHVPSHVMVVLKLLRPVHADAVISAVGPLPFFTGLLPLLGAAVISYPRFVKVVVPPNGTRASGVALFIPFLHDHRHRLDGKPGGVRLHRSQEPRAEFLVEGFDRFQSCKPGVPNPRPLPTFFRSAVCLCKTRLLETAEGA